MTGDCSDNVRTVIRSWLNYIMCSWSDYHMISNEETFFKCLINISFLASSLLEDLSKLGASGMDLELICLGPESTGSIEALEKFLSLVKHLIDTRQNFELIQAFLARCLQVGFINIIILLACYFFSTDLLFLSQIYWSLSRQIIVTKVLILELAWSGYIKHYQYLRNIALWFQEILKMLSLWYINSDDFIEGYNFPQHIVSCPFGNRKHYCIDLTYFEYYYARSTLKRYFNNSEAYASELLENLEECFLIADNWEWLCGMIVWNFHKKKHHHLIHSTQVYWTERNIFHCPICNNWKLLKNRCPKERGKK